MSDKSIYITDNDMNKLRGLVKSSRKSQNGNNTYLQELESELNRAKVVKCKIRFYPAPQSVLYSAGDSGVYSAG